MTDQLDIFGRHTPVHEVDLSPGMAYVAREEREQGVRFTADEAGALLHERRGKHGRDERCEWCARDGADVLDRLRGRQA
jgi:hypothetical protein